MKKNILIVTVFILLLSTIVKGQLHQKDTISILTKGEKLHVFNQDKDGFISYVFKGEELKNIDLNLSKNESNRDVTGDCRIIRFLSFKKGLKDGLKLKKEIINLLGSGGGYREMAISNKSIDEIHFFACGNNYNFTEFHILHYSRNRTSLIILQ